MFNIPYFHMSFSARPVSGLILFHQLRVEGFIVWRWNYDEWSAAFKEMAQWIQEVCDVWEAIGSM